ncbi:MAG: anion permease, partial [Candidatus Solibacter sp.]|nr:anion permease [Candidatus Solibacter sp.]
MATITIPKSEAAAPGAHRRSTRNRIVRGAITVSVGVAIWLLPVPAGVAVKAWHLLAIFFATIIGLILQPVPMGAVVLFGMTATTLTA